MRNLRFYAVAVLTFAVAAVVLPALPKAFAQAPLCSAPVSIPQSGPTSVPGSIPSSIPSSLPTSTPQSAPSISPSGDSAACRVCTVLGRTQAGLGGALKSVPLVGPSLPQPAIVPPKAPLYGGLSCTVCIPSDSPLYDGSSMPVPTGPVSLPLPLNSPDRRQGFDVYAGPQFISPFSQSRCGECVDFGHDVREGIEKLSSLGRDALAQLSTPSPVATSTASGLSASSLSSRLGSALRSVLGKPTAASVSAPISFPQANLELSTDCLEGVVDKLLAPLNGITSTPRPISVPQPVLAPLPVIGNLPISLSTTTKTQAKPVRPTAPKPTAKRPAPTTLHPTTSTTQPPMPQPTDASTSGDPYAYWREVTQPR